jgi:hypothetical protein
MLCHIFVNEARSVDQFCSWYIQEDSLSESKKLWLSSVQVVIRVVELMANHSSSSKSSVAGEYSDSSLRIAAASDCLLMGGVTQAPQSKSCRREQTFIEVHFERDQRSWDRLMCLQCAHNH